MTPRESRNLEGFVDQAKRAGKYLIGAAYVASERDEPKPMKPVIEIEDLQVRPAWQIGENDLDGCALLVDDEPIIPDGVTDPPALKALEQRRLFRSRKRL